MSLLLLLLTTMMPAYARKAPVETNPDPHAEDVALQFGWPAGLVCEVAFTDTRSRSGSPDETTSGTVQMAVSSHAEGLLVRETLATFRGPEGAAQAALARAAALAPDRIVSGDGQLRRLENLPAYDAAVAIALQPAIAETGAAAAAQTLLARTADVPALQSTIAAAWRRSIGFWPGLTLIPGAHVSRFGEDELPFLPGTSLTWNDMTLLVSRVGCDAADTAQRCVQLDYSGTPSARALRSALAQSGKALLAPADARFTSWSGAGASIHSVFVLEPGTLIPHSEVQERALYATARFAGGAIQVVDLKERLVRDSVCTVPTP